MVSLPLHSFTSRNVSDGAHLFSQISNCKLQSLSPSWSMQSPSTETPLLLFKLECLPPLCTPQIVFSIKVFVICTSTSQKHNFYYRYLRSVYGHLMLVVLLLILSAVHSSKECARSLPVLMTCFSFCVS